LLPPIPRRKRVVGKRRRALKADRVSLTARLWRTVERQVRDIEERLAHPSSLGCRATPERERDVRMLASLTRTLRDLAAFDVYDLTETGGGTTPAEPEPSIEELRASVLRKLQNIISERDESSDETSDTAGVSNI
jgi:hypothetical protein